MHKLLIAAVLKEKYTIDSRDKNNQREKIS